MAISGATPASADGNEAPGNPFVARSIAAGDLHTCAIEHNATVKCWGNNNFGQLGLGDTDNRGDGAGEMGDSLPAVNLGTGRTATAITAGGTHTCALLDDATVKCWGRNNSGQLGQNDTVTRGDGAGEMGDSLAAVNLGTGRTATAIAAGGTHTCALLDNATVKCWGDNGFGQLGLGDTVSRGIGAGQMGNSLPVVSLGTGRTATAIAAGTSHTCALLDNATVKCWGFGATGQLGQGDALSRGGSAGQMGNALPAISLGAGRTATAVTVGNGFTCATLDNASVKCWGQNNSGQLGLGDVLTRGDGAGEMGNSLPAVSLGTGRSATSVAAGSGHVCARLDDATIKCWGSNGGSLGLGDNLNRGDGAGEMGDSLPTVSLGTGRTALAVTGGSGHTCARLDDTTVKCWGNNNKGQLGRGNTNGRGGGAGEMGDSLAAIRLGTARTATTVSVGNLHTCALLDNGTVKCWGFNGNGRLGLGDTANRGDAASEMGDALPAVNLGTGRTATAIAVGGSHTCALLDNNTVKCWGLNASGQLGLADVAARGDAAGEMGDSLPTVRLGVGRTATAIAAGTNHTCALLDNHAVKCWGLNTSGQLGQGDTANRGDAAGEMGSSLPAIALGAGRTATAIVAGNAVSCAVLDNGAAKCWGANASGRLGQGDVANRGDGAGEMGDNLPAIALGTGRTATRVTTGSGHTCALLDDATVKCWGLNSAGQLGQGDVANRGDGAGEMGDNLPAIALGTGRTATAVVTGDLHTCAVLDNGQAKCWGDNVSGGLGLGNSVDRGDNPGEMGNSLPEVSVGPGRTVSSVSAGTAATCARLDNGSVKCWGLNNSGHLGLGDTIDRGDAAGEMGDALVPVDLGSGAAAGVSGTVTDAVSAAPIAGAFVAALRTTDFSIAGGAVADGSGNYTVALIPGAYFLYLVDPSGAHVAAFAGAPTTVTVLGDTITDTDATMAPTRGSVTGTVTESGPNTPVPGAFALALSGTTGAFERGVVADGSGAFTLAGLNPGNHFVGWLDPTGNHAIRFFPNSPNVPDATPVNVSAGGSSAANGSLPTQTAAGTGANLTGTVTETGTGTPIAGAFVVAFNAADFTLARSGVTNGSGAYTLNVTAGAYKLAFIDASGLHDGEWHNNQPLANLAGAASVTAPTATNATLARNTGTMSGTVTDDPAGTPIAGAWVLAIGPTGINGGAITAADGTYTITNLPPGTYRAAFVDPNDGHTLEYFDNSADFAGADTINITAATDTAVSAALALP